MLRASSLATTRPDPDRRTRIYVSSSALDLAEARARVIDVVRRNGCQPVSMETYGADTQPPIERCLADVRACEIYIGIVAFRYGSTPPDSDKSFTHLEYEEALANGKQVLLFHLDEQASWPAMHVDQLQDRVRDLRRIQEQKHVVDHFNSLDQLAARVRRALHRLLGESVVPVPDLLPYIADRHAQQDELARAARDDRLGSSPSVVVLHGAAEQAHHKFTEYMQEQLLARYLQTSAPVRQVTIPLQAYELADPDLITWRIAGRCFLDDDCSVDRLSRRLHELGWVTMLRLPVEVEIRRGRPRVTQVSQLINYFRLWPVRKPLRVLPVISAQYRPASGWAHRAIFGRPTAARLAAAIRDVAGSAVVLPQLGNVAMVEAEVWTELPEVRRFFPGTDPLPAIRRIFREYEQSTREQGMPMEKLAAELTYLLRSSAA